MWPEGTGRCAADAILRAEKGWATMANEPVDDDTLHAWWAQRQGLDGSLQGASAGMVLERTGWSRSVGGSGPYLTLYARAGITRTEADAAVVALEIHELQSARGCTYVVPAADFGLALRVGQTSGDAPEIVTAKKFCGVTDAELARLNDAVLSALATGPLDPAALKAAVGDAVRALGPEGKKRGLTTTLPLALGTLQSRGAIRRVPVNGRLDQQRYRYVRWDDMAAPDLQLTLVAAQQAPAPRYFRWSGPATLAQFQWLSGLSAKAVRAAGEPPGLGPLASGDTRLRFPQDRGAR